jgi:hypothetical protein
MTAYVCSDAAAAGPGFEAPHGRRGRGTALVSAVLVAVAVVAVGCGAPDRREEATALEATLETVSGVDSVSVSYEHGGSRGSAVSIDVSMTTASTDQIGAMVKRMNDAMGRDFDDYHRPVTITAGDQVTLVGNAPVAPAVAARNAAVSRAVRSGVPSGSVRTTLSDRPPDIEIRDVPDSLRAAGLAVASLSGGPGQVRVYPTATAGGELIWNVDAPSSEGRLQQVAEQMRGLPADAYLVSVVGSAITEVSVTLPDDDRAFDALTVVIDALGADRAHPLRLNWVLEPDPRGGKSSNGTATVGNCDYQNSAGEQDPQRFHTADALALQQRMRERYDTCPR